MFWIRCLFSSVGITAEQGKAVLYSGIEPNDSYQGFYLPGGSSGEMAIKITITIISSCHSLFVSWIFIFEFFTA